MPPTPQPTPMYGPDPPEYEEGGLPFLSEAVLGLVLAAVAGIMVFISLDELVPVARSFGEEHWSIVGVLVGMVVMAFSLWQLQ